MAKYRRNQEAVKAVLVESKAGQVLTKVDCKIQAPARFTEGSVGLGSIGSDVFIYGIFALILDTGEYSVCNIAAQVQINPYKTTSVMIDDVEYHEFHFHKNDVVIKTTDLVKNSDTIYSVFDELIFKGKVPWYMGYEDLGKLFDTAKYHADSNVATNLETIELIASMISRSKEDRTEYIRHKAKDYKDVSLEKLEYVPLKSVFYSVKSTLNKLAGSYFNDGVVSALVEPSEKQQMIESVLRR